MLGRYFNNNLPGKDGLDLLLDIRKDPRFLLTPIYLYSSTMKEEMRQIGLHRGANDCFEKPSTVFQLNEILRSLLSPLTDCPTLLLNDGLEISPEARYVGSLNNLYQRY